MRATDLDPGIWNAIAGEIARATVNREIVFAEVTKRDTTKLHIFCDDFGDTAIPLVGFHTTVNYYDTDDLGSVNKRTTDNADVIMPKVGDIALILDLGGGRTFPVCLGVLLSKPGFWEGD